MRPSVQHSSVEATVRELECAAEQIADSLVICDRAGVIKYVNPAFERQTGYHRKEALGNTPRILKSGQHSQSFYENLWNTILSGRTFRAEFTNRRKNDELYYEERTISPLKDDQGNVTAFISLGRDITERRRIELKLRLTQFAIDNASVPAYWMEADGRFFYVNNATCRMLGFSREELLSMTAQDIDSEYRRESWPNFWAELKQYSTMVFESAHRAKDGSVLPVEIAANYLGFKGNEYCISFVRDLRDRQQAARRFDALVEAIPQAILVVGGDGVIKYANAQGEKLFGYHRGKLLGQSIESLLPEPLRKAHVKMRTDYSSRPQVRSMGAGMDLVARRKDGSEFPVEIALGPIGDESGSDIVATIWDISERKRLDSQLRQAQKMEAVGQLAGGVAHDFNNILMVIRGYSELLLKNLDLSDPARHHAKEIQQAAGRAASLTQQLLAFSRKQVLQPKVLDLNTIVCDMDTLLRSLISEDIGLSIRLARALYRVQADPTQIEQVIMNLAINARDAMSTGGRLTIETANMVVGEGVVHGSHRIEPGSYVTLSISDTGLGMDSDTQQHIFEPFFTTKELGKGTGLGLATVYGIVKQSRGYIWVISELGQGTTFTVYLPRFEAAVATEAGKTSDPLDRGKTTILIGEDEMSAPLDRGKTTILIVEDEMSVRRVIREFLRNDGYTVLEASDGPEAMQTALEVKDPIHLLVTDVVMPGMSGGELAQRLISSCPGMKVLFVSGYTEDTVVLHGVSLGESGFLQKPFTMKELARKIGHLLCE